MDEYLRRAARERPEKTALVDAASGDRWTYRELTDWAESIAGGLARTDVYPGERVGLLAHRSPEALAAIWGILRRGGVIVPLDPEEAPTTIHSKLDRSAVETVVKASADGQPTPEVPVETVVETDVSTLIDRGPNRGKSARSGGFRRGLDETRVILFTSGTTGDPNGVRLTGRNIGASAASTVERLGAASTDRWLLDLPLYHAGGLSIPIRTAMLGAATVLRRTFDAEGMAATIGTLDVTGVSLVPTMLDRLLKADGNLDSLRFVLVGGATTPPELVRRALQADLRVFPSYGMTETASGIATATPEEVRATPETVGRPVRAASVSVLGQDGRSVEAGDVGEIVVSGPIVSPGPIGGTTRRPAGTLRTGDRGYLTDSGRLFVTGRIDEVIVTGGENVSPREVEAAIRDVWPVEAVAVIGLPDEKWGEQVAAAVVPEAGAAGCEPEVGTADFEPEDRMDSLRKRLAPYKIPKTVRVVDEIPRTASGTVDRPSLRATVMDTDRG